MTTKTTKTTKTARTIADLLPGDAFTYDGRPVELTTAYTLDHLNPARVVITFTDAVTADNDGFVREYTRVVPADLPA